MPSIHNTTASSAQGTSNPTSTANANSNSNVNARPPTNSAPAITAEDNESTELTKAVDDLLEDLRTRFAEENSEMLAKMDEMSRRLDNLEASMRTEAAQAAAQAAKDGESGGGAGAGMK